MDIRKWVLDYGLCQDFDVDDAVSMVRTALVELGTTPNTGSPKLFDDMESFAVACDRAGNGRDARKVRAWVKQLRAGA